MLLCHRRLYRWPLSSSKVCCLRVDAYGIRTLRSGRSRGFVASCLYPLLFTILLLRFLPLTVCCSLAYFRSACFPSVYFHSPCLLPLPFLYLPVARACLGRRGRGSLGASIQFDEINLVDSRRESLLVRGIVSRVDETFDDLGLYFGQDFTLKSQAADKLKGLHCGAFLVYGASTRDKCSC